MRFGTQWYRLPILNAIGLESFTCYLLNLTMTDPLSMATTVVDSGVPLRSWGSGATWLDGCGNYVIVPFVHTMMAFLFVDLMVRKDYVLLQSGYSLQFCHAPTAK